LRGRVQFCLRMDDGGRMSHRFKVADSSQLPSSKSENENPACQL
jgi:hypothetical protein